MTRNMKSILKHALKNINNESEKPSVNYFVGGVPTKL